LTLANFDSHGIDSSRVGVVSGSSGVAVIWVEPGGTNRIIVVPGANQAVLPEAAAAAVEAFSDASVVIGQLEVPQQSTAAAFEAARRSGAVTVLNPAPAASLEPELLKASDWIILNEVELSMLGGSVGLDSLRLPVSLGRKRLVVTLGDRGAVLLSDGGEIWVDAEKVAAVDTTGAGDAFVGAFAYGLAAGLTEVEAVRLGCACATESVTRPGTQASFKAMPVPPRPRPGWQSQPT
jgi:ribokinase